MTTIAARTLVDLLRQRSAAHPDRLLYTFLANGERESEHWTYGRLDQRARQIAAALQQRALAGARVIVSGPSGGDYVAAFFGCLYAGAVAVPQPPGRGGREDARLAAVLEDARAAAIVITGDESPGASHERRQRAPGHVQWLGAADCDGREDDWRDPRVGPNDLAYLQYTSGSTSVPKGVEIRHGNVIANEQNIQHVFEQDERSIVVGWLPLYHDMGLVGTVLQPLYSGARAILFSPAAFLQRPVRWLEAISAYRATTSGGPDFAYELCARRVGDDDKRRLDLGSWKVAFNGSEPIHARTLDDFAASFAVCGFTADSFLPCYGLAEATLLVSGGRASRDGVVRERPPNGSVSATVVNCGAPAAGQTVVVVDPATLKPLDAEQTGEICVAGPNVARGYFARRERRARTFNVSLPGYGRQRFLRTGDLGYLRGGSLYVTGRIKDLLIVRGRNHYPHDVEYTVSHSHPAAAVGRAAAFAVPSEAGERVVVVQELHRGAPYTPEMIAAIRRAVADSHEIAIDEIAIVKAGAIPRTTSGKVQRAACRDLFVNGTLATIALDRPSVATGSDGVTVDWHAIDAMSGDARADLTTAFVRERVAQALELQANTLTDDRPFAELGLDSMKAVELQQRIEDDTSVALDAMQPLGERTVQDVARHLLSAPPAMAKPQDGAPPPTVDDAVMREVTLSAGQRALWYLERMTGQAGLFNIAVAARIHGNVDVDRLERAFQFLVDRHAALRTSIVERQGGAVAHVHPARTFTLDRRDVSHWSDGQIDESLRERANEPFNLEADLLLRAHLYKGASSSILLVVVHHQVADFWSLVVLFRELAEWMSGAGQARPAPALEYADFARSQAAQLAGPRGDELRRFWRDTLSPMPSPVELPTERPRPSIQTYRGAARTFVVPRTAVDALAAVGRAHGATLYTCLCAVFEALLYRYTGKTQFVHGTLSSGRGDRSWSDVVGYFVNPLALVARVDSGMTFVDLLQRVRDRNRDALRHQDLPFVTLVEELGGARDHSRPPIVSTLFAFQSAPGALGRALAPFAAGVPGATLPIGGTTWESIALDRGLADFELGLTCADTPDGVRGTIQFNADLFAAPTIDGFADAFVRFAERFGNDPSLTVDLPLVAPEKEALARRAPAAVSFTAEPVSRMFERICAAHPPSRAVAFEDRTWTFDAVNRHANRVARRLVAAGAGPERIVGIFLPRCGELPIAMLGVLKSGAAYVPLDVAFPRERLAHVVRDAGVSTIVTTRALAGRLAWAASDLVCIDECTDKDASDLDVVVDPDNAAYLLYTSGSTGQPKGVVVTHRNLANFFAGMDRRIGCGPADTMLAVSAATFDISVLELLWTLTRGCGVVIAGSLPGAAPRAKPARPRRPLDWSLFYFAQNTDAAEAGRRYRLLFEGARFADANGFTAVWTPERHFDAFGGLYPNPAVTSAALAAMTRRIGLRAGSVVLPLHNPIRVAEEWAVVDNMSGGRVALAFASGWHADDFALAPDAYGERKARTYEAIETVRRLWRGERITVRGGAGNDIAVRIFPSPLQPELPVWVTAAGAEDTFRTAGRIGANVLTHLLGQTIEDVERSIAIYRAGRSEAGHDPDAGIVTLMVHTFVAADDDRARRIVREPMKQYLRGAIGLIGKYARSMNLAFDPATLSDADRDALLDHAFERYFHESSLLGSSARCRAMADRLAGAGVNEVACLIDFGVDDDVVLGGLQELSDLRDAHTSAPIESDFGFAAQVERYRPTLLQCTPSLMQVILTDGESRDALGRFTTVLVGGEACPADLLDRVRGATTARLFNMYGPTETTIWSTTCALGEPTPVVPLGDPIANTRLYVLDDALCLVPAGLTGELWLAGEGLARGYRARAALTAERFVPDPFGASPGARMYRTGDIVKVHHDGAIEWIGRRDHQVKLRGHRVEPGEIEAALLRAPGVREAAVVAARTPAGAELRAFVVTDGGALDDRQVRADLESALPAYMVPQRFVGLAALPRSTSGKIDRAALASYVPASPPPRPARAGTAFEQRILAVWRTALGRDDVGLDDNFFDAGGNSLLIAQVHSELQARLGREWPLVRMLEHPTVGALATFLNADTPGDLSPEARRRSASRRSALLQRQSAAVGAR